MQEFVPAALSSLSILLLLAVNVSAERPAEALNSAAQVVIERPSAVDPSYVERLDARGRLVELMDPSGGVRRFGYDETGQMIWRTDADGSLTTYEYEERRLSVVQKPTLRKRYLYDGAGGTLAILRSPDQVSESQLIHRLDSLAGSRGHALPEEPRIDTDASGRVTFAANALASERFDYGRERTIDLSRTFEHGAWSFSVTRRQITANSLTISDSGGGRFVLQYRRGFDQVARISSPTGAILLDRSFDSVGRLVSETLGERIRVEYEYAGAARMWSRKNIFEITTGQKVGDLVPEASDVSVFRLGGKSSRSALESAAAGVASFGAEIRGTLTQKVGFVTAGSISWYVDALDGPYAVLDDAGALQKRVFTVEALGTPFSKDCVEIDDQYLRLVLDSPSSGGRTVVEMDSPLGGGRRAGVAAWTTIRGRDVYICNGFATTYRAG